jgi:diacylglycerol kinase
MKMKGKKKNKEGLRSVLGKRIKSFRSAFSGVVLLLKFEYNARIHLAVFILVLIVGFLLKISAAEWLVIVFAAGLVFASECFNTALEYLADEVSPRYSKKIKKAKDVAAAGVLISAAVSVIVGIIVFLPRIIRLLTS